MAGHRNPQLSGHILLHSLDCVIFEFHDLAALFTDEMVMMVLAGDLVACLIFIEMTLCQQLAFLKEFESPVDCCVADVGIYFLDFGVKFLGADMAAELEKDPGNVIAGRGGLEPTVA